MTPLELEEVRSAQRRAAAAEAVAQVISKGAAHVGLGTGRAAEAFIAELARRRRELPAPLRCASSSSTSTELALKLGLEVCEVDELGRRGGARRPLEVYADGADRFLGRALIKGGGGALERERMLALASEEFIVIVEEAKECMGRLGGHPVPLVVREQRLDALERLAAAIGADHGGTARVRLSRAEPGSTPARPALTPTGGGLIDLDYPEGIDDPRGLAARLEADGRIVSHGLFLDMADVLCIGRPGGVEVVRFTGSATSRT